MTQLAIFTLHQNENGGWDYLFGEENSPHIIDSKELHSYKSGVRALTQDEGLRFVHKVRKSRDIVTSWMVAETDPNERIDIMCMLPSTLETWETYFPDPRKGCPVSGPPRKGYAQPKRPAT